MTTQPLIDTSDQSETHTAQPLQQAAAAVPEAENENAASLPAADVAPASDTAIAADAPTTPDTALEAATDTAPATEEAMRKPVPPVEAETTPDMSAEGLLPPPTTELPKPKQSTSEPVSIHDAKIENLILLPEMLSNAEKHLATHIGSMIDPMLEKNLLLSVSSNLEKGTTSLILSFEGDMVPANPAVLSEQVVAALHKIPAMETLFAQHHHTPVSNVHDGKLQVMIPHLTTAQYSHLMQSLATGIEAAQAPVHSHPAAEVAAEVQANAAAAMAGHPPATEVAAVNHEGLANDNAPALTQTAVGR